MHPKLTPFEQKKQQDAIRIVVRHLMEVSLTADIRDLLTKLKVADMHASPKGLSSAISPPPKEPPLASR